MFSVRLSLGLLLDGKTGQEAECHLVSLAGCLVTLSGLGGLEVGPTEGSSRQSQQSCRGEIAKQRGLVCYISMGWTDTLRN